MLCGLYSTLPDWHDDWILSKSVMRHYAAAGAPVNNSKLPEL
jgi:hypothetical protein